MQFSNISKEKVLAIAKGYNHRLIKEEKSYRPNRIIMVFEK